MVRIALATLPPGRSPGRDRLADRDLEDQVAVFLEFLDSTASGSSTRARVMEKHLLHRREEPQLPVALMPLMRSRPATRSGAGRPFSSQ